MPTIDLGRQASPCDNIFWMSWLEAKNKVFRYCRYKLNLSHHDSEDLCSETMLKAYDGYASGKLSTLDVSWFITVSKNAYFDFLRKRAVVRRYEEKSPCERESLSACSIQKEYMNVEIIEKVRVECDHLPPPCRDIFLDRYFRCKSYKEISALYGCRESYARKQVFLAKKKLVKSVLNKI